MTARKLASHLDANGKKIMNLPVPANGSSEPARKLDLEAVQAAAISRANHTGTQLAVTISDFAAAVRLNRLDQMAAPTTPLGMGSQRITGVADPVAAQDVATKKYTDDAITGLASGQVLKGSVRAVATTNIAIASPGTTIDGLTPTAGQIFYLDGQTTGTEKGPWTWNGAATPMTRPANWDTGAEAQVGSYWIVTSGTKADTLALLTNDTFVLGTDTPAIKIIDVAAASAPPFEQDMGDGTATSFLITHNLNTRAVAIHVYRNASPYDEIDVAVERTSVNSVTVAPDEVWSTNQFHAVVAKL